MTKKYIDQNDLDLIDEKSDGKQFIREKQLTPTSISGGIADLPANVASAINAESVGAGISAKVPKVKDLGKPIYSIDRQGNNKIIGYEPDPETVRAGKISVPKPPEILAIEKQVGGELEPVYAVGETAHGRGTVTQEYGAPIGYRYDNGKSQYVNFDTSGKQTSIVDRQNLGTLIKDLAPLALTAFGANYLLPMLAGGAGATAAGAGTLGAAEGALTGAQLASLPGAATGIGSLGTAAAFSPEMIAAGTFTPGSAGALGAASGALTGAELAAAGGIGSLGTELAALPASEVASLPGATTSLNEMVASGTFTPGSAGATGAATGALTPAELAAASGVVTEGATPALVEMAKQGAQDYIDAGGSAKAGAGNGPGGTDVIKSTSLKEAIASGLGPGSAGAKAAAEGMLTPAELAAAAGTTVAGSKSGITDLLDKAKGALTGKSSTGSGIGFGGTLGLLALMSMMNKGSNAPAASTATIPELTATRTQLPYDVNKKGINPNTPYRPGQGGVTYFSPTTYTPKAAGGGLMSLGGLGSYSDGGRLLQGPGDGVSDSIPAIIGKKQPARLANGEFVIPARIVSELGNGSTDAGAKRLYEMMDRVQKVRRKTKNVAANTKAAKYLPA